MKRPPKKPHFFTFVCSDPSSRNGSVIPKSFIRNYLKGVRFDFAVLKRGNRTWAVELGDVKIKGETARIFADGWEKFEKDNGLEMGDVIVFRHEGNMVFEILVFDPTFCEREFPIDTMMEGKKISLPKGTTSKKTSTNMHVIDLEGSEEMQKVKEEEDDTSSETEDHPSFLSTLKAYSIKRSALRIPLDFSRSIGLSSMHCVVIFDEKQRSWPIKLRNEANHVYFGKGWTKFRVTNGLKEGDEFMIELTKNGNKPIMNFRLLNQNDKFVKIPLRSNRPEKSTRSKKEDHDLDLEAQTKKQESRDSSDPIHRAEKRTRLKREVHDLDLEAQTKEQESRDSCDPIHRAEKRTRFKREIHDLDLEAQTKEKKLQASSTTAAKDHFIGILKRYCFDLPNLYFPIKFARSNGLTDGQMILENENGKMWLVELRLRDTGMVYIARGWKEFRIANNLKEGDAFKIELMENTRDLPIAKFSCL